MTPVRLRSAALVLVGVLFGAAACADSGPSSPDGSRAVAGQPKGDGQPKAARGGRLLTVDLGTLGGVSTEALDINNRRQIVGWSHDGDGRRRPFLWTPRDGMVDLGTLGGDEGVAKGVNNRGTVVGWSRNGDGLQVATKWTGPGEAEALEEHDFGGPVHPSAARAVNNAGKAVGYTHGDLLARWGPDGSALVLDGCPANGVAFDVNGRGAVVGIASTVVGAFVDDREFSGFVWTEETGCVGLIDEKFVAYDVQGMNNRGDIVGVGGTYEVVEPGLLITLITEGVPFVHDRRRGFRTDLDLPDEPRDVNNRGTVVGDGVEAVNESGDRVGGSSLITTRPRGFGG